MVEFRRIERPLRRVGVGVALVVSIATSSVSTTISGATDTVLVSSGSGASTDRSLELSVHGHPALTQETLARVAIAITGADEPVRGFLELVDELSGRVLVFRRIGDAGPDELREGRTFEDVIDFGGPLCSEIAGCTRSWTLRLRDAEPAGVPIRLSVTTMLSVSRREAPPGAVAIREVVP